jgi:hypothetical protein
MLLSAVLAEFDDHAERLREAHRARKAAVALTNVVEDREEREAVALVDTLGRRQPSDVYAGDVERGWERCALLPASIACAALPPLRSRGVGRALQRQRRWRAGPLTSCSSTRPLSGASRAF